MNRRLIHIVGLIVSLSAIVSVFVSQTSYAQEQKRRTDAAALLVGTKRVQPDDPTFRPLAAALLNYSYTLDPKIIKGTKIDTDMYGSFIYDETFVSHKSDETTIWHTHFLWFAPDQVGTNVRKMTPAERAIAETLFLRTDLSRVKGVSIDQTGITGQVTAKDLGITTEQFVKSVKEYIDTALADKQTADKELSGLSGGK